MGGIWLPVEGVQDSLGAHVRQLQKRKAGSVEEVPDSDGASLGFPLGLAGPAASIFCSFDATSG